MQTIGLALGGGGFRGIAHIGVCKALEDRGIRPRLYSGSSAGALVAALFASGMHWTRVAEIAYTTFWPSLFMAPGLRRFCELHLPPKFSDLVNPLAVVARDAETLRPVILTSGNLATALLASTALRPVRSPVKRSSMRLTDPGVGCGLPTKAVREIGANYVIASDVWSLNALTPASRDSSDRPDMLIRTNIPAPGLAPVWALPNVLIAAGERATHMSFRRLPGVRSAHR